MHPRSHAGYGEAEEVLLLTEKLLSIDGFWGRERQFSLWLLRGYIGLGGKNGVRHKIGGEGWG